MIAGPKKKQVRSSIAELEMIGEIETISD